MTASCEALNSWLKLMIVFGCARRGLTSGFLYLWLAGLVFKAMSPLFHFSVLLI